MKAVILASLALGVVLAATSQTASCQGTFQNLGFESVSITPTGQRGFFPFAEVFPGWTGYQGTNQSSQAFYNGVSLGAALCSIIGRQSVWSNSVISGNYTAVLAAGEYPLANPTELLPAAIAQSGLVPSSTKSLRFRLGDLSNVGDLSVTFEGQTIPFYPLSAGANYAVYGGDLSMFAGVTGELRFTQRPITWPTAKAYIDSIQFSPDAIPEPGVLGLLALGGLLFAGRFRKRRL